MPKVTKLKKSQKFEYKLEATKGLAMMKVKREGETEWDTTAVESYNERSCSEAIIDCFHKTLKKLGGTNVGTD